jgi:diguanylate cyclase (GGDEF)-like protein
MGTPSNILPSPNSAAERAELDAWVKQNQVVLDLLLDAYCVVDSANRVTHFNVAFTELCGESYRKVTKIGDFCSLLHTELCPERCPAKEVAHSKKAVRWDEVRGASKAYPDLNMILSGVPLRTADGRTLGSLLTIRNVTAELLLQRKYDERKRESIIDGLTGLFNKVYSEEYLVGMVKNSLRDSHPVTVVMCDVDHFKKVNDTYGHQAGDFVLARVSALLKGESRDTDAVGRFGGEEFIAMLFKSDPVGARVFAERFRKRVESTTFTYEGTVIPITISIGTASFSEVWKPGMDTVVIAKELIHKADTALYYAKRNGRNQSRQWENLPTQDQELKKAS